MTDIKETMERVEEGAKSLGHGPGDYHIQIDLSSMRLASNYKSFGENGLAQTANAKAEYGKEHLTKGFESFGKNGSVTEFRGYSEKLEKAAHGKDSRLDKLLNAVKAPFKPKAVSFTNLNNNSRGGR